MSRPSTSIVLCCVRAAVAVTLIAPPLLVLEAMIAARRFPNLSRILPSVVTTLGSVGRSSSARLGCPCGANDHRQANQLRVRQGCRGQGRRRALAEGASAPGRR